MYVHDTNLRSHQIWMKPCADLNTIPEMVTISASVCSYANALSGAMDILFTDYIYTHTCMGGQ